MRAFLRLYQYINILSIDIAAGAAINALVFATIFKVQVKTYGLLALGLTVWIIYTVDHLRDAKKIKHRASTQRHRFHQKYFHALTVFLCLALVLDAVAIFFIRKQVFEWGLILSSMVVLYLIAQHYLTFLKEIIIAALYTCGVVLLSISVTTVEVGAIHYLIILQFGFIAWINLVLFSWFDQAFDLRDQQNSFVTKVGKRSAGFFLYGLFICSALLTVAQITLHGPFATVLVLFTMSATLFIIFTFRIALAKNDAYRLLGDAVFLFPVILLV